MPAPFPTPFKVSSEAVFVAMYRQAPDFDPATNQNVTQTLQLTLVSIQRISSSSSVRQGQRDILGEGLETLEMMFRAEEPEKSGDGTRH